ncbi:MAG TPA: hypothetical protein VFC31_12935 [Candidatus Limnocylindria bacterium]|nr:hypothetical protein [Candidatus Limnocylindria bacterium]
MGLPILFRGAPTITGSGASTFSATITAAAREVFAAAGASGFGFAGSGAGAERFGADGASTFTFADAASARETFTGAAASTFVWTVGAAAYERFSGTGAGAFGFAHVAAASGTFAAEATSILWTDVVASDERLIADGASAFTFAPSGSAVAIGPLPSAPPLAGPRLAPRRRQLVPVTARGASAFAMRMRARALHATPPIARAPSLVSHGASHFAATASGLGALDLGPVRIAREDEAVLLGIDDEELVVAR